MKQKYSFLLAAFCLLVSTSPVFADNYKGIGTLSVNGLLTQPESFYLSHDDSHLDPSGYYKTDFKVGPFTLNHYWGAWGFGGGFTYSNCTDKTTPGFSNMSAYTGTGKNGDSYLIANSNGYTPAEITFNNNNDGYTHKPLGAYFTNSSYSALSMLNGDSYAKKFGGDTGEDPDWFLLTIIGYDDSGEITSTQEFYLADYRFDNSAEDYVVKEWTWVDLTPLGEVSKIGFSLTSSDNGTFGMNTPSYFCMDGLEVEISSLSGMETPASSLSNGNAFYSDGQLYIQGLQGSTASLYSLEGTLVETFAVDRDTYNTAVSVRPGVYLLKIHGKVAKTIKIVIK